MVCQYSSISAANEGRAGSASRYVNMYVVLSDEFCAGNACNTQAFHRPDITVLLRRQH